MKGIPRGLSVQSVRRFLKDVFGVRVIPQYLEGAADTVEMFLNIIAQQQSLLLLYDEENEELIPDMDGLLILGQTLVSQLRSLT